MEVKVQCQELGQVVHSVTYMPCKGVACVCACVYASVCMYVYLCVHMHVCMCVVCVHIHVCICMCTGLYVCMQRPEVDDRYVPLVFSISVFETGSLTEPEAH